MRHKIDVVSKNDIFGEIGALTNLKRTATVVAREHSVFQTLDRDAVFEIQRMFPNIFNRLYDNMYCYVDEDMVQKQWFQQYHRPHHRHHRGW